VEIDLLKDELSSLRHLKKLKMKLEPSLTIPPGIVDFLCQNSPSTKVDILDAALQ
jgi:hypothetical protein